MDDWKRPEYLYLAYVKNPDGSMLSELTIDKDAALAFCNKHFNNKHLVKHYIPGIVTYTRTSENVWDVFRE